MTSASSRRPPRSPDLWVVFIRHRFSNNPKLSRRDFHACLFTRVLEHLAAELREDPSAVSCQERRAHLPDSSDSAQRIQTRNFGAFRESRRCAKDALHSNPIKSACAAGGKVRRKDVWDLSRSLPVVCFLSRVHRSSIGAVLRHRATPAAAAGLTRQAGARRQVGGIRACQ